MEERLVRLKEVCEMIGMKQSWVYSSMRSGRFPKSVCVGVRSKAWRLSEVQAFIKNCEDNPGQNQSA